MHKADEAVNLLNLWCTATHHKSALAPKHPFYSVLEPKVGMYQNEVNCLVRHIVTYVNQVEYNNMYKGVTLCDFLQLLSAIYYTYINVYIYTLCMCIYILCMCVYIYIYITYTDSPTWLSNFHYSINIQSRGDGRAANYDYLNKTARSADVYPLYIWKTCSKTCSRSQEFLLSTSILRSPLRVS